MRSTAMRRATARTATLATTTLWTAMACAGLTAAPPLPYGEPVAADVTQRQITGPVLQATPSRSLSEVVSSYWPTLGRQYGPPIPSAGGEQVGVYANGALIGGLADLRAIRSGEVVTLQRLTRSEEYMRFGTAHPQGAIILTWRTR
jgi:hypothetical protein